MWRRETRRRRSSNDAFVCFGLQELQGHDGGSERAENIVGKVDSGGKANVGNTPYDTELARTSAS